MTAHRLDVQQLYAHLDWKRKQAGRSWRAVAREVGVNQSLFSRLKAGHAPDAHALVTLLAWLDLDISYVTKPEEPRP